VILTGVEYDHADIYPDMQAVERAFGMLVERVPEDGRILVCADSEAAVRLAGAAGCPVETYSASGAPAQWAATRAPEGRRQRLEVRHLGRHVQGFDLALTGAHNAQNALGVCAVAHSLGIGAEAIAEGMRSFAGVRRRQEVRGVAAGVTVIDDFAHHPTAIRETLAGLRGVHGAGRLVAVFEPRSATSRRRVFQADLPEALSRADHVVLGALHAGGEGIPAAERLDPGRVVSELAGRGIEAHHMAEVEQIVEHLAGWCAPGDSVVVMSSGGFGGLIDRLLQALRRREADGT
jgi:UDP-N-acetylmuramate: L-alanyl-gamma-D-glutamyl-meso-diaminopimelate ligase